MIELPPKKKKGSIGVSISIRNFSENSTKNQDKAIKWARDVLTHLLRIRKHIHPDFRAEL